LSFQYLLQKLQNCPQKKEAGGNIYVLPLAATFLSVLLLMSVFS
jgi:hypothetical protein